MIVRTQGCGVLRFKFKIFNLGNNYLFFKKKEEFLNSSESFFMKKGSNCVIIYFQTRRRRSELFRANSTQARCVVASYEGNMEMINTYLY